MKFYRCMLCGDIVNKWDIVKGGCPKCSGKRMQPTNLTLFEKIAQIIKNPNVWRWNDEASSE